MQFACVGDGRAADIIDEYTTVFRKSGKRAVAMAPACAQFLKDYGERTHPTTSGEARKACKIHDRCWGDCESVEGKCEDSPDRHAHVTKQEIWHGDTARYRASTWQVICCSARTAGHFMTSLRKKIPQTVCRGSPKGQGGSRKAAAVEALIAYP